MVKKWLQLRSRFVAVTKPELSPTDANILIIDLTILDNEQEALAKITEALARVYFDNVLRPGYNIEPISKAYTIAFNLCPNYRVILRDKPGFDRYKFLDPEMATITSLPIYQANVIQ